MAVRPMDRVHWHGSASVRNCPPRQLAEHDSGLLFFSTSRVPAATHPRLRELLDESQWRALHVQHLYRFMEFTTRLEQNLVNPVLAQLAQRQGPVSVPTGQARDAHRIYVDEAYHALEAADLVADVMAVTGVAPSPVRDAPIDDRIARICARLPDRQLRALAMHVFTVVSETMISATLTQVPNDDQVVGTVREVIADHAVDEGRHHRYFADYLPQLWEQLTVGQRRLLAPLVPVFITEFLAMERESLVHELVGHGLDERRVRPLVGEIHEGCAPGRIRDSAAATLRYFGRLDSPELADAIGEALG